jgi:hypothetical protein
VIYLKACPRCRGDLVLETAFRDGELVCLQCAFRATPETLAGRAHARPQFDSAPARGPRFRTASARRYA